MTELRRNCPCCNDPWVPTPGFTEYPYGHQPMHLNYECPECDTRWEGLWCSAVDDTCPHCGTSDIAPIEWDYLDFAPEPRTGQMAYEANVYRHPTYHDGTPRKTWGQLGKVEQWSWRVLADSPAHSAASASRPPTTPGTSATPTTGPLRGSTALKPTTSTTEKAK